MGKSTQWNPSNKTVEGRPTVYGVPTTEHSEIRHTTLDELTNINKISGGKLNDQLIHWAVVGLYFNGAVITVIRPGYWLNENDDGSVSITPEPVYHQTERKTLKLTKDPLLNETQRGAIMKLAEDHDLETLEQYLKRLSKD